jgi:hypothetical protein
VECILSQADTRVRTTHRNHCNVVHTWYIRREARRRDVFTILAHRDSPRRASLGTLHAHRVVVAQACAPGENTS